MNIKLTLIALSLFSIASCKKEKDPNLKNPEPKVLKVQNNLPGLGSIERQLVQQPNGTYKVVYFDEMTFANIIYKTGTFSDGERVANIEIINDGNYLDIQIAGSYFMVVRPTYVGNIAPTIAQFNNFRTAYGNFIENKKDATGTLIQPSLPNFGDYIPVNSTTGQHIITGQIVMSHTSSSTLSVVPADYVAPVITPIYTLISEVYIRNGIRYDLAGDDATGEIKEVIATNIATNTPVTVYGFSGTYVNTVPTTVYNLKIYTSPTDYFEYSGQLSN